MTIVPAQHMSEGTWCRPAQQRRLRLHTATTGPLALELASAANLGFVPPLTTNTFLDHIAGPGRTSQLNHRPLPRIAQPDVTPHEKAEENVVV